MIDYNQFIESKRFITQSSGFKPKSINENLFPFQRDIVNWALQKGKAAIFAGTGLGKSGMQSEWAYQVHKKTKGKVLILAPLAVASQTVREAKKILGIDITLCKDQTEVQDGVNIANYERLHLFDPNEFMGIVLDESSILKSYTSKTRIEIIESFKDTPYKLACTATPAPNDFVELGNHSEFLGVMNGWEMLSLFFINDGDKSQKWRLKRHAESKYWEWVASWAVMLQRPSDLGYEDGEYQLPPLNIHDHVVKIDKPIEGFLFAAEAQTLQERQQARRGTVEQRVKLCAELVNKSDKPFLVWCDLNSESEMLTKLIDGAVEVKGSDKPEHKEWAMKAFADGEIRILVSKPSICGFGMNFQRCADMAFVGLSDSFEQVFQAVRRCYRFGQKNEVNVHMIISELEGAVANNIKRKESDFERMSEEMIKHTMNITKKNIRSTGKEITEYNPKTKIKLPSWV